jgi:hypothetical protein
MKKRGKKNVTRESDEERWKKYLGKAGVIDIVWKINK